VLRTYFLPKFDVIRQIIDAGVMGENRTFANAACLAALSETRSLM